MRKTVDTKNLFYMFITIAFLLLLLLLSTRKEKLPGSGTYENPFVITDIRQLISFLDDVSGGNTYENQYIVLEQDIDFNMSSYSSKSKNGVGFKGCFDGKGHRLYNLSYISAGSGSLFYYLDGIVCNLMLESGQIQTNDYSASIATYVRENGSIINCCNMVEVYGDFAGGITYKNEGTLINDCNIIGKHSDAAQKLVIETEDGLVENCYTGHAGYYELIDTYKANPDMVARVIDLSVKNLNDRVTFLSRQYPQIKFCKWVKGENYPELTNEKISNIESVTVTKGDDSYLCEYDNEKHCFIVKGITDFSDSTFIFTDSDGKVLKINNETDANEVHIDCNSVDCIVAVNIEFSKKPVNNSELFVDIGKIEDSNENISVIKKSFYSQDGQLANKEKVLYINNTGTFRFSGSMQGQIIANLPENADVNIILDNVNIETKEGPAIKVYGSAKECNIIALDGSDNYLAGCDWKDMYHEKHKNEGVISSELPLVIGGDGRFVISSLMEGIESDDLSLTGGVYDITSYDDGISSKDCSIVDSKLVLDAGDNAIDADKMTVKNSTIQGMAPYEHSINGDIKILSGVIFTTGRLDKIDNFSKKSSQNVLLIFNKRKFGADDIILLTDADDKPLIAYKNMKKAESLTLSIPDLKKGNYRLYNCSSIDGNWDDNICTNITSFDVIEEYSFEGEKEFLLDSLVSDLKVDEE